MTKEEVLKELQKHGMDDMIELIEDAEKGYLEQLELVESIGLVYDKDLNTSLIEVLKQLGVEIIFVTDEEESS
ncbi:hypothetical protein JCM9140_979 [Halalkalibacter wakoensis JCM 9140]|uniref:Uncharacterized protein n=1 Tax=Halalkalibacter wakoensis JCM 9140 TaxID=1236970 RepID=W4PZB2_9BACI|nr:hypothetical protein [Halalkalibacter wakoensis]GAE25010.1 hypothetical protein JCM9140_979 [Halalkalibacter wakoensis JCM 9140]